MRAAPTVMATIAAATLAMSSASCLASTGNDDRDDGDDPG
jgi:hypothetical protein